MISFRKSSLLADFNFAIKQELKFEISIYKKMFLNVKIKDMTIILTKGKNYYDYTAYVQDGNSDSDLAQVYFNFENISAINCSADGKVNSVELTFE